MFARAPPHPNRMTYVPAKVEVATANSLDGDAFAKSTLFDL